MNTVETNFVKAVGASPKNVIIDLDVGTDDAWALLMLIAADARKEIKILAITCVYGNTTLENVCRNVVRLMEAANRLDIPIYRGSNSSLITLKNDNKDHVPYHGMDGFGDIPYESEPDTSVIQTEHAISAIHRIISEFESKGEVSLVCLSPLTNIALALKTYPNLGKQIKSLYIMGGNSTGKGNITLSAEFNFYSDPEAAHIVLAMAECPVIILPWETCLKAPLSLEWRFEVLGAIENKPMALLNAAERSVFEKLKCSNMLSCDQLLTAALLRPNMVTEISHIHMTVELQGHHTRGQAVIDHNNSKAPNVILIQDVDVHIFKEMMLFAAGH